MLAYVVAGLTFTLAFGLLVVGAFHGVHVGTGTDRTKAIADIVGGLVLVAFGFVVLTGHASERPRREAPGPGEGLQARLGRGLTMTTSALAGPLTHIPGI